MSTPRTTIITISGLRLRREEIPAAAARHGAHNVRVYGSVACGEADERSDADFFVEFEPGRSPFACDAPVY